MIVQYMISSPHGDILVGPDLLERPFRITPSQDHPSLTLGDYFHALETFLFQEECSGLDPVLAGLPGTGRYNPLQKALIRSEKHGALYHIASVELVGENQSLKLAVSTAVTDNGKHWIHREYHTLQYLEQRLHLPYLPRVYGLGDIPAPRAMAPATFCMVLAEWLEGYREWHLTVDETDGSQKVSIWDTEAGHRPASAREARQIFKQASKVLTLYYDTRTYCQIFPWHHAAGDFVVNTAPGGVVDVKLSTARKYEPVTSLLGKERMEPMAALLYFFLNMTIRMRLDKRDGLGEALWADRFSLEATAEGFLDGLTAMEKEKRLSLGRVHDLISLMKSLTTQELGTLFLPLLSYYEEEDPADRTLIEAHLKHHIKELHEIIQKFR